MRTEELVNIRAAKRQARKARRTHSSSGFVSDVLSVSNAKSIKKTHAQIQKTISKLEKEISNLRNIADSLTVVAPSLGGGLL